MALQPGQVQALNAQEYEWARAASEVYFGEDVVDVASAAVPPEYPAKALSRAQTTFNVALGINTTVPALAGARKGMRVTFVFNATGVFTITWNAQFAITANGAAANAQSGATSFIFNGTKFVQEGGALAFK